MSTWIYRLSVNASIDYLRQNKKYVRLAPQTDISNINIIDTSNDVEKNVLQSENIELLNKCINLLSFVDKTLVYFYLEDLKYKEIAEILGITEKNVSVKLVRIKKILKKFFRDFEE